MTLRDTIAAIERLAAAEPAVAMIVRNDVFRLSTIPDAKYGVFAWTQQQHTIPVSADTLRYTFNLFYVDRITENIDNEIQIQSTGVQVLGNVLRGLPALGVYQAGDAVVRTFNQRFEDACAGAFATVTLEVGVDTVCHQDYDPLPIPII